MTLAPFELPPMVAHDGDHARPENDLRVMQPFFINNGLADTHGVDKAHTHYPLKLGKEVVLRVDFPKARTRVTSVVSKAKVDPERAVGWWTNPEDGAAVPWLFAAEEIYAAPGWPQDLAEIGRFLAANKLTKYGVRSLQRPWAVREDEIEVEFTNPQTRTQVFAVIPRSTLDGTEDMWESVWEFKKDGPLEVTDCFNYCGL